MSVCGQSGQAEDDSASEEVCAPNRDLYKQKPASKVVRVLTVLAYLLFVSLAAILLSVYYVCVWKSPELPAEGSHSSAELSARRADNTDYAAADLHHPSNNKQGGGDITINVTSMSPPVSSDNTTTGLTSGSETTDPPEGSTDSSFPTDATSQLSTSDDIGAINNSNNIT